MKLTEQDARILKVVTEHRWTTGEMCAVIAAFEKYELPRVEKIYVNAKKFLKKHRIKTSIDPMRRIG